MKYILPFIPSVALLVAVGCGVSTPNSGSLLGSTVKVKAIRSAQGLVAQSVTVVSQSSSAKGAVDQPDGPETGGVDCEDGYVISNGSRTSQFCDGGPSANQNDGPDVTNLSGKVTKENNTAFLVAGKVVYKAR